MDIQFNYDKLSAKEKNFYDGLSDKDKAVYEKSWIDIEKQKKKVEQAKARMQKMKTTHSQKERKAETRYKIQLGGEVVKVLKAKNITLSEDDLHLISDFLMDQEERGSYFTNYINKHITSEKPYTPPTF